MRVLFLIAFVVSLLSSCSPIAKRSLDRTFKSTERDFQDFTGFMLYDAGSKKTIYEYNAAKYFTPASNTKIFTFFTSLNVIGDSIPALRYVERGDSLIFWGTGDPSFLYKHLYNNGKLFLFLKNSDKGLYFSTSNFHTSHFGSGWAWDDYNSRYSPEKSPLPVYGNLFSLTATASTIEVQPKYLRTKLTVGNEADRNRGIRNRDSNDFQFFPSSSIKTFATDIPLKTDPTLTALLLADTLKRDVQLVDIPVVTGAKTLFSVPSDSLYRVMMQDSDNFIAEQLLLVCSGILTDSLQTEITIRHSKKTFLKGLIDEPIWIDGSGLSRYNLFTPRSIVQLWERIYEQTPRERLFPLLATGGKAGTIRNWYKGEQPYVFGKTGSLSNNHCLSGFLITRKGETLIFSFMNSNFTKSSVEIRNNMQDILRLIYENY